MWRAIRSAEELIKGREKVAREIALRILDETLHRLTPDKILEERVLLRGDSLEVRGISSEVQLNLREFQSVVVIAFGKAASSCWSYAKRLLGERISEALVVVPRGGQLPKSEERLTVIEASHPLPDESSLEAGRRALELVSSLSDGDLLLTFISGGGSSLLELPKPPISLAELRATYELLMKAGANIHELNAVRRAISELKGGRLAHRALPAKVLSVILSDVLGSPIHDIASGPTAESPTTTEDAIRVLKIKGIWEEVPAGVREVLTRGDEDVRLPEDKVHNVVVADNRLNTILASEVAEELGLKALTLSTSIQGEASVVGRVLGAILRDIKLGNSSLPAPLVVLTSGETTVTVKGDGKGGRNQELALGAALELSGLRGVVLVSAGTDGIDGFSPAAGGIVDGGTLRRALELGYPVEEALKRNDSYTLLSSLGDAIITGPTGTNFMDLQIGVVL